MEVQLTDDQRAFARRLALLATLDDARASIARGEGRVITPESMREVAAGVSERGRAHLLTRAARI